MICWLYMKEERNGNESEKNGKRRHPSKDDPQGDEPYQGPGDITHKREKCYRYYRQRRHLRHTRVSVVVEGVKEQFVGLGVMRRKSIMQYEKQGIESN